MRKFIIIAFVLFFILFGAIVYLNQAILPVKIKSLIVSALKKQTGKDVTLRALEFSIFRGLILHDLVISDNQNVILSTRRANCSVFVWPIFKKQIIIPSLTLRAPYIFLERRADKSFNLQDFLSSPGVPEKKSDFSLSILKISVLSGNLVFQDSTLATKFKKEIRNIQLNLYLSLPASVKFNFKGEIAHETPVLISASGKYKILNQELLSDIEIKNLSVGEFAAYYNDLGDLASGLIDLEGKINLKGQVLQVKIEAKGDNLTLQKDKLRAKLNSRLQAKIDYQLQTGKLNFDGNCDISDADISGVELIGGIKNLRGKFTFNQQSLVADSLKAELLGLPFEIKLGIKDFKTPVLSLVTDLDLSILPGIAKEKFKFTLINQASGKGVLAIKAHPDNAGAWLVQGELGITGARLRLDKQNNPIEDIAALIQFSQQGLSWKETKFRYDGLDYQTSGTLSDFSAPLIKLKFFSRDLTLAADFNLLGKKIKITQLRGKYLDSLFSASGGLDSTNPERLQIDLNGKLNLQLNDLSKMFEKQYPALKSMRLRGQLDTQFNFSGIPADFKSCYLRAKLSSDSFSFYGLNASNLSLDFLQDQRIVKIPSLRVDIYDGFVQGSGMLDLDAADLAYQLELKANGIKLEKLKMDTPSKDKNISGDFSGELKLNGFADDLNKLNGQGSFAISKGRLWELNLLQGVGKILFAKDLGSIELSECTGNFLIREKFISTDNLQLKGNIANLSGPLKIGFDGSLEGALDVDILSEMVPVSGTLKDITTAIIGETGKFGVIKLSGSLGEPKYSFKPQVGNIIKGLSDLIFGK